MKNDKNNNSRSHEPDTQDAREIPSELKAFEAKLVMLRPSDNRLDREALIFRAGQASVDPAAISLAEKDHCSRSATFWSRSFAGMTVLAATLLAMLLMLDRNETEIASPLQSVAQIETVHSPRTRFQASRMPSENILSTAPYCLRQMDHLLAASTMEPLSAFPDEESGTEDYQRIRLPKSIPMLLKESIDAEFLLFDSPSASPNLGAPS